MKSAPDGYTLSIVSNNHVIYPSVYKSVPFDPIADITPIAVIGSTPIVIVVNAKVPAKNAQELIALLKANPGKYNYGSSGNGTILHLAAEMFFDEAGVKATHVPYKGVGPMLTDLIGGQVEIGALSLPSVQQHLKSGALRAIGVGTAQRLAAAPEIPTMVEQGLPNYLVEGWFAVIGPAKLPPADVKRIRDAFAAAFATPEVSGGDGETGQYHQRQHDGLREFVLPERAREVREAREEGGHRAAVSAGRECAAAQFRDMMSPSRRAPPAAHH